VGHAGVLALQELWKAHISLLLESLLALASSSLWIAIMRYFILSFFFSQINLSCFLKIINMFG
jgi:hypothetical protein